MGVDVDVLECPRAEADTSIVCGQALYGRLGSGDEYLGDAPLGTAVFLVPAHPRKKLRAVKGSIDATGRFSVSLPVRVPAARLCIEGSPLKHLSEADRCRDVQLNRGRAVVSVNVGVWPFGVSWTYAKDINDPFADDE